LGFLPFGEGGYGTIRHFNSPDNPSGNAHYAAYAGALIKLRIARGFYFTPSAYLTFYQNKHIHETSTYDSNNDFYYGMGATVGFEYFISDRISLNTDLLFMGYGFVYRTIQDPFSNYHSANYFNDHGYAHVIKYCSLGVHYNFGKKK
ncbi:MAG: hypothetical protein ABI729_10440, partial [Chitinophagales bacterium]